MRRLPQRENVADPAGEGMTMLAVTREMGLTLKGCSTWAQVARIASWTKDRNRPRLGRVQATLCAASSSSSTGVEFEDDVQGEEPAGLVEGRLSLDQYHHWLVCL